MAMEIVAFGQPEAYFVVPMEGLNSHSHSLVHFALTDYCSIFFLSMRGYLDEASS
tara:strand:+ start:249 stop:413 length:165 start_codon:yes stop_codon:yes gene_type:complete